MDVVPFDSAPAEPAARLLAGAHPGEPGRGGLDLAAARRRRFRTG
ncbi:hypothetical protein [Nonomuraea sp. NPDC049725]